VTSLALNRLGGRETAAIIARLVGNKELPADVMAEIVERTDGVPLFVEEMTKAVLEGEGEGGARPTAGAFPFPEPDFHRLDRTSFGWRTNSITSSARAEPRRTTSAPTATLILARAVDHSFRREARHL
jgi:hypothetical protein